MAPRVLLGSISARAEEPGNLAAQSQALGVDLRACRGTSYLQRTGIITLVKERRSLTPHRPADKQKAFVLYERLRRLA